MNLTHEMNLCKDCIHFQPDLDYADVDNQNRFGFCSHTLASDIHPATGKRYRTSAYSTRLASQKCGPEGKWFLPRTSLGSTQEEIDGVLARHHVRLAPKGEEI